MEYHKKGGGKISSQDLDHLKQLIISIEQAEEKLEQSYKKKRPEQFNAIKQFILKLNRKIEGII